MLAALPISLLVGSALACGSHSDGYTRRSLQATLGESSLTINGIAPTTRTHWMRQATLALGKPCPFAAFGAVIVNHTDTSGLGELVCTGANSNSATGNPIMHGEMAAITNCSAILTDPNGPYNLTAAQALRAFASLSIYSNAESCPMCASAIRWAGFREYIYGTSIETLIEKGWGQIRIPSMDVFKQSFDLGSSSRLMAGVLANETDPYFLWQFDPAYPCPEGCARDKKGSCAAS